MEEEVTKKNIGVMVLAVLALIGIGIGIGVGIVNCSNINEPVDVTIKIVCQEVVDGVLVGPILDEWIFTPDVDRMCTEREFDGRQYKYYAYAYSFSDNPQSDADWHIGNYSGPNSIDTDLMETDGLRTGRSWKGYVSSKGEYYLHISTGGYFRTCKSGIVRLYITVK